MIQRHDICTNGKKTELRTMSNSSTSALNPTPVTIIVARCFVNDSLPTRCARIFVYCLIAIVSLIGNSLVVTIVCKDKKLRKPINNFIVNMCCSDLLITAVYMPRVVTIFALGYEWLIEGTLGIITCKIVPFIYEVSVTVSLLTVVMISVERFILLVFPFKTIITNRLSIAINTSIWFIAAAFRFPISYAITLKQTENKIYCDVKLDQEFGVGSEKVYYQVVLVAMYAVPLAAIIVLYSIIVVSLKKQKSPGSGLNGQEEHRDEQRNRRVLRMVLVVVAVFVICWMLYFIQLILYSYKVVVPCEVRFVRWFLAHSNSAITPCLYFAFSEHFHSGLMALVGNCCCGCCRKCERRNQDATTPNDKGIETQTGKN